MPAIDVYFLFLSANGGGGGGGGGSDGAMVLGKLPVPGVLQFGL